MRDHPPIPVTDLADNIDRLKANDGLKFSQEYEVSTAERRWPGLCSDPQQRGLGSCRQCLEAGWEPASKPCQPQAVGMCCEQSEHGLGRERAECTAARPASDVLAAIGANGVGVHVITCRTLLSCRGLTNKSSAAVKEGINLGSGLCRC